MIVDDLDLGVTRAIVSATGMRGQDVVARLPVFKLGSTEQVANLLIELEDDYGVDLDWHEFTTATTVGDLVCLLKEKTGDAT